MSSESADHNLSIVGLSLIPLGVGWQASSLLWEESKRIATNSVFAEPPSNPFILIALQSFCSAVGILCSYSILHFCMKVENSWGEVRAELLIASLISTAAFGAAAYNLIRAADREALEQVANGLHQGKERPFLEKLRNLKQHVVAVSTLLYSGGICIIYFMTSAAVDRAEIKESVSVGWALLLILSLFAVTHAALVVLCTSRNHFQTSFASVLMSAGCVMLFLSLVTTTEYTLNALHPNDTRRPVKKNLIVINLLLGISAISSTATTIAATHLFMSQIHNCIGVGIAIGACVAGGFTPGVDPDNDQLKAIPYSLSVGLIIAFFIGCCGIGHRIPHGFVLGYGYAASMYIEDAETGFMVGICFSLLLLLLLETLNTFTTLILNRLTK